MAITDSTDIHTVVTEFTRYLYAKHGCRPGTVVGLISSLRRWAPVIGVNPTEEQIHRFIADMSERGKSYSHLSNTAVAFERYTAFLGRPITLARTRKPKTVFKGMLNEEEISRLLSATTCLRDKTMLALLCFTGMRNQELCFLTFEDVDLDSRTVSVRGEKVVKDRTMAIPDAILPTLKTYMEERGGTRRDLLFLTKRNKLPLEQQDVRKLLRSIALRAGITKRVYPHLLRHSLATNLIHSGAGIYAIKQQLGHENVQTTIKYLHTDPDRLRREFIAYAPKYKMPD